MKLHLMLPIVLGLALSVAAPASAATPNAVLKSQLRAQKAKVAKITKQLRAAKTTIKTLNGKVLTLTGNSTQAQTDLATRTTERDGANRRWQRRAPALRPNVLTGQAAAGSVAGLSPDQLWALIGVIYPLIPNADVCGYSRSFYASGSYTSYTFTRYVC